MKIRNRITLYFILITGTLIFVSFILIYFFAEQDRIYRFERRLKNKAITSANLVLKIDRLDSMLLESIDRNKKDYLVNENIVIFNEFNKKIYDNNDTINLKSIINVPSYLKNLKSKKYIYKRIDDTELIGLTYKHKNSSYLIFASAFDYYGLNYINALRYNLILIFVLILFTISVTGWRFSKSIITPIQQITDEVNSISSENLEKRLPPNNNFDEISRLINTFNKLLDRIERGYQLQKNFTSNTSHELKNPLTSITMQLEVAKIKRLKINEYENLIDSIYDDIISLNQITESMILLTRLNENQRSVDFPLTRIDEFILLTIEGFIKSQKKLSVETNLINLPASDEGLYYPINSEILKRAILNILDNAQKYSKDKRVVINLSFKMKSFDIEIINLSNHTLTQSQIDNIAEPFQRGNSTKEIQGYGLGLSIVKQILKIHSFQFEINLSEENVFKIKIFSNSEL